MKNKKHQQQQNVDIINTIPRSLLKKNTSGACETKRNLTKTVLFSFKAENYSTKKRKAE